MLIVSAYYDIPSKQPASFYYEHIRRFFKYIRAPVLFFTDQKNHDKVKHLAGDNVEFKIQPFEDMAIFKNFPIDFWKHQITKDPEKYHTWQVGAVWANKSGFVKQASEIKKDYEWYMWVDAGCVRTDAWQPHLTTFGKRPNELSEGVYYQLLSNLPTEIRFFRHPDTFIAGSHILFHTDYICKFIDSYENTLRDYALNNQSVISDQYIMARMSFYSKFMKPLLFNNAIHTVSEWFFFFSVF